MIVKDLGRLDILKELWLLAAAFAFLANALWGKFRMGSVVLFTITLYMHMYQKQPECCVLHYDNPSNI